MLGYRKACCYTFDSYSALKQIIRPQEWLCHSWLRMVQSLQITGVKRNVLFLQRASMRQLIKGKHEKRCSFLERKGDRRSRWIVVSSVFVYGKPADVLRLKSVFSLTSYLLTLTYLLMVTHRLMSFAAHTDLQISLGICTDLELRSSFMLYSTQGYYF